MWTNVAILLFVVIFFLAVGLLKQKEGFGNPTVVSQEHQGDLATIKKQLAQINVTDENLNTIQEQIMKLSNQTTTLQVNLPVQSDKYN